MANESKNLIIPTGWLKANATLPGSNPELPASYTIDFGQAAKSSLSIGGEIKENFTGLDGIIGMDKADRVKVTMLYGFDQLYFSAAQFDYLFGAGGVATVAGATPDVGAVTDLFFWFGLQSRKEKIQSDGTGLFVHHSFKGGLSYDGELTFDGENYLMNRAQVRVYLGSHPGKWHRTATRPLPTV